MKVCLVCSHGGHLTEMMRLMEAFQGHDVFFITYHHPRTESLPYRKYLMNNVHSPMATLLLFPRILSILMKEEPDIMISTGDEIAIPSFLLARILRVKTIYIESWCRVRTTSGTGRIVYRMANEFLVQWPDLAEEYGKKAKYEGAVV